MKVRVDIRRKEGLSDPEGVTTQRALQDLGFGVDDVHFGRSIYLDVDGGDAAEVRRLVDEMCRTLLANPVMEEYEVVVEGDEPTRVLR